jgi:SAM-dependent methyltransferase
MDELIPKIHNWFEFLSVHKDFLQDRVRNEAYCKAIPLVVQEGSTVLDLGTGTGFFAFLAVKAGARKVYAIESMDIIRLAEEIGYANGMSKKITFIKGDSRSVALPEKVDVILSEILGHCVLDENMLDSIIDAKLRFLKNDGCIVPQEVKMFFAPVFNENTNEWINFWKNDIYGIDYSPAWRKSVNTIYIDNFHQSSLLAKPKMISHVDLRDVSKVDISGNSNFITTKTGLLNGFAGWFETILTSKNNIYINTGPGYPKTHWNCTYFPLENPIEIKERDEVFFSFKCYSNGSSTIWEWIGAVGKRENLITHSQHSTALY